jgi:hypothetical protein
LTSSAPRRNGPVKGFSWLICLPQRMTPAIFWRWVDWYLTCSWFKVLRAVNRKNVVNHSIVYKCFCHKKFSCSYFWFYLSLIEQLPCQPLRGAAKMAYMYDIIIGFNNGCFFLIVEVRGGMMDYSRLQEFQTEYSIGTRMVYRNNEKILLYGVTGIHDSFFFFSPCFSNLL